MRTLWMLLLTLGFVVGGCISGSDDKAHSPEVREIAILAPPAEARRPELLAPTAASIYDYVRLIEKARDDANVKGLFFRLAPLSGAWGQAGDLRNALESFRAKHKPVHCHFDTSDSVAYYVFATSCDRISMEPAGDLDLVGVVLHLFYARQALQKIGFDAELLQIGQYKGAADPFTRDDMPEPVRESLNTLLDDLYGVLIKAVAGKHKWSLEEATSRIDAGPYDAQGALAAGLIDTIAPLSQARSELLKATGTKKARRVKPDPGAKGLSLGELLSAVSGDANPSIPDEPRIAVLWLEGSITDSEDESMTETNVGPFVKALHRFGNDKNVKAVVLRIDSPGGSALASDRMWHAVRNVAKTKPVIASIGNMAASGGYYVASAARYLMAHENSLVGSIGVVGGKITFEKLAENLGVHTVVLERGKRSGWTSPVRPFSDEERAVLERLLMSTYDRFLARVSTGRKLSKDKVQAVAEGRIMSGKRAVDAHLVDKLGSLGEALAEARKLGKLGAESPVEHWPREKTLLEALAEGLTGGSQEVSMSLMNKVQRSWFKTLLHDIAPLRWIQLKSEPVLVQLPFSLNVD